MSTTEAVTLVKNAIHNPSEPRHFMRLVPSPRTRSARLGDEIIVESDAAVLVREVGRDIYDEVVYFPRADVDMSKLTRIDKSTHCPLKGDTEYFDVVTGAGISAQAAWSYVEMIDVDGVDELKGLIAFDSSQITIG